VRQRRPTARPAPWAAPRVSAGRVTCATFPVPTGQHSGPWSGSSRGCWIRLRLALLRGQSGDDISRPNTIAILR
jgi:hypothetical protein